MDAKVINKLIVMHDEAARAEHQQWNRWNAWYMSDYWDELESRTGSERYGTNYDIDDSVNLETNFPFAFIDTMIANICPSNPQVTVNAADPDLEDAAKARERLANDCLRRDKLHRKAWKISAQTSICGWGVSKTVWRKNADRPTTIIIDPRNFYWDRTVPFEETPYCIEIVPVKRHIFKKRSEVGEGDEDAPMYDPDVADQADSGKYPRWLVSHSDRHDMGHVSKVARDAFEWVVVYEVYDFEAGKYYHMLKDVEEPLFEGDLPYTHFRNPYDLVVFNQNLRDSSGVSDIKLIRAAQERLNEIDSLELEHAHKSVPVHLVNTALLDNPEDFVSALTNADAPGGYIPVRVTNNTLNLESIVFSTTTPSLSPSFDKMRERTNAVIEFILGIPQYSRGVVGSADIATEVALADTATRTRNGRRIKVLEDWVQSVAMKCVALTAQFTAPEDELEESEKLIPIRDSSSGRSELVSRAELDFDNVRSFQDAWVEFEAVPYSPTENHRLVTLRNLQTFIPMMLDNPNVDPERLARKLLDLLSLSELFKKAAPAPAGPPGMPGGAPINPQTEDPISAGGMPEGLGDSQEAILPPGARAEASQPKLEF